MRQKPKVIGAKIASTELDEKRRTYYDLCPKEEPIVIKPRKKNVYPKCDEKFVKIVPKNLKLEYPPPPRPWPPMIVII